MEEVAHMLALHCPENVGKFIFGNFSIFLNTHTHINTMACLVTSARHLACPKIFESSLYLYRSLKRLEGSEG